MGVDIKNHKDITELKNKVIETSSKGFGYFVKNLLLVIFIILGLFVTSNFNVLMNNPAKIFSTFTSNGIWIIGIMLILGCGIYQLASNIYKTNKQESGKELIKDYRQAEKEERAELEEIHTANVLKRIENSPKISMALKDILINLGADRACVAEMHNGTNNLNGLPFIFFDVSYEEVSPNADYVADDFKNFNMVKFPFIANHFNDGTFIGPVEEIEREDKYLGKKFRDAQAEYGAAIVLQGVEGPLGFLTATFVSKDKAPKKAKIIAEMNQAAQIISTLLDKS